MEALKPEEYLLHRNGDLFSDQIDDFFEQTIIAILRC